MTARPLALERTEGGMTLSGPKAWRGSTKLHTTSQWPLATQTGREEEDYEARIRPTFLQAVVALAQITDYNRQGKLDGMERKW